MIVRWDEGLLDMCIGDKRKLTIPPEFGYGQRAMGSIPAGSTLSKCRLLLRVWGCFWSGSVKGRGLWLIVGVRVVQFSRRS